MAKRTGPNVFTRGKTYWYRFVIDGKEYRGSLRTSDGAAAKRFAEKKRAEIMAAVHWGEHRTTYDEAVFAWAAEIVTNVGDKTVKRYMTSLRQMEKHLRGLYVDQIEKQLIQTIIAERRAAGVTNATIRRDLGALSSVLAYCEDRSWCKGNAAFDRLRRVKERRDPITLPDAASVARMADRCPRNMRAIMLTALHTGCRQSELTGLKRDQVDWTRKQLTVIGKGNKRRTLDLSPEALDALKSAVPDLRTPHVFQHDGQPYLNLATRFRKLMVGVEKSAQKTAHPFRAFRFHDLRHLYAVNYLKAGGGIYTLSLILGHTSVKVTEIYLAHLSPDEAAHAKAKSGATG